jgi:hypothetical protein
MAFYDAFFKALSDKPLAIKQLQLVVLCNSPKLEAYPLMQIMAISKGSQFHFKGIIRSIVGFKGHQGCTAEVRSLFRDLLMPLKSKIVADDVDAAFALFDTAEGSVSGNIIGLKNTCHVLEGTIRKDMTSARCQGHRKILSDCEPCLSDLFRRNLGYKFLRASVDEDPAKYQDEIVQNYLQVYAQKESARRAASFQEEYKNYRNSEKKLWNDARKAANDEDLSDAALVAVYAQLDEDLLISLGDKIDQLENSAEAISQFILRDNVRYMAHHFKYMTLEPARALSFLESFPVKVLHGVCRVLQRTGHLYDRKVVLLAMITGKCPMDASILSHSADGNVAGAVPRHSFAPDLERNVQLHTKLRILIECSQLFGYEAVEELLSKNLGLFNLQPGLVDYPEAWKLQAIMCIKSGKPASSLDCFNAFKRALLNRGEVLYGARLESVKFANLTELFDWVFESDTEWAWESSRLRFMFYRHIFQNEALQNGLELIEHCQNPLSVPKVIFLIKHFREYLNVNQIQTHFGAQVSEIADIVQKANTFKSAAVNEKLAYDSIRETVEGYFRNYDDGYRALKMEYSKRSAANTSHGDLIEKYFDQYSEVDPRYWYAQGVELLVSACKSKLFTAEMVRSALEDPECLKWAKDHFTGIAFVKSEVQVEMACILNKPELMPKCSESQVVWTGLGTGKGLNEFMMGAADLTAAQVVDYERKGTGLIRIDEAVVAKIGRLEKIEGNASQTEACCHSLLQAFENYFAVLFDSQPLLGWDHHDIQIISRNPNWNLTPFLSAYGASLFRLHSKDPRLMRLIHYWFITYDISVEAGEQKVKQEKCVETLLTGCRTFVYYNTTADVMFMDMLNKTQLQWTSQYRHVDSVISAIGSTEQRMLDTMRLLPFKVVRKAYETWNTAYTNAAWRPTINAWFTNVYNKRKAERDQK